MTLSRADYKRTTKRFTNRRQVQLYVFLSSMQCEWDFFDQIDRKKRCNRSPQSDAGRKWRLSIHKITFFLQRKQFLPLNSCRIDFLNTFGISKGKYKKQTQKFTKCLIFAFIISSNKVRWARSRLDFVRTGNLWDLNVFVLLCMNHLNWKHLALCCCKLRINLKANSMSKLN